MSEVVAKPFVERLRREGDPSTRYKLAGHREAPRLASEIQRSKRVAALLSERGRDGRIARHPYTKWTGAHWVLATLADLGYPARGPVALAAAGSGARVAARRTAAVSHACVTYEAYLAPIRTIAGRVRIHAFP